MVPTLLAFIYQMMVIYRIKYIREMLSRILQHGSAAPLYLHLKNGLLLVLILFDVEFKKRQVLLIQVLLVFVPVG